MNDIFLSIIVPVYNVEKYLDRCVRSILEQDAKTVEILLIDDGSTDRSSGICDWYAHRYPQIRCFHKKNGGLSDARNYGIRHACGEYLWFVDSDDYIAAECLPEIVRRLQETACDVFVCQSKVVTDSNEEHDERKYTIAPGIYDRAQYMDALKKNPKSVLFCAQYHICRRAFVESNHLYFYKGIIHEDELWTPQLLLLAEWINYSGCNVYYHYMRSDSIMHASGKIRSGESDLIVTRELLKIFGEDGGKLTYMRDHMADTFLQAVWKLPDFLQRKDMIQRTMPIKNAYYGKTRLKALLYFISPTLYLKLHEIVKK